MTAIDLAIAQVVCSFTTACRMPGMISLVLSVGDGSGEPLRRILVSSASEGTACSPMDPVSTNSILHVNDQNALCPAVGHKACLAWCLIVPHLRSHPWCCAIPLQPAGLPRRRYGIYCGFSCASSSPQHNCQYLQFRNSRNCGSGACQRRRRRPRCQAPLLLGYSSGGASIRRASGAGHRCHRHPVLPAASNAKIRRRARAFPWLHRCAAPDSQPDLVRTFDACSGEWSAWTQCCPREGSAMA